MVADLVYTWSEWTLKAIMPEFTQTKIPCKPSIYRCSGQLRKACFLLCLHDDIYTFSLEGWYQKIKYQFLWCVSLRLYIDIWLKFKVGLLYCKSFPFYQSSIGSNTRSPFCEIVSYETIRKPPLLDPLLWVGDPVSEMVKMGLLYAWVCFRVRMLWVVYLGLNRTKVLHHKLWLLCAWNLCQNQFDLGKILEWGGEQADNPLDHFRV